MVFGHLIVRTLLLLVHLLGRLGWSCRFAATLDAAHRPFHLINYAGSAGVGRLLTPGGELDGERDRRGCFPGEPSVQRDDSGVHDRGQPPGGGTPTFGTP